MSEIAPPRHLPEGEDILQKIVANKRIEVEQQKKAVSLQTLLAMGFECMERPTCSMRAALAKSSSGIIAEFKRKSPSKGWLHPDARIEEVVPAYKQAGASACSILTDGDFFGGSLRDLKTARKIAHIPLLRKDFIIDEYQLFQARVMGADAVLLIAALLTDEHCAHLAATAHSLNLEVLLEIHNETELSRLNPDIDMLGINNRNLGTFHTNVENSFRLAEYIRENMPAKRSPLLISESGISDAEVVCRLRRSGFRGFLIGETFMKTQQPGETLAKFIGELQV
jgi:indole-3-glycerol phosphate synthase